VKMFDAGKTRMIGLPYGEKWWQWVKPFSSDTGMSRTDRRTDRQHCYINIARQCADAQQKLGNYSWNLSIAKIVGHSNPFSLFEL